MTVAQELIGRYGLTPWPVMNALGYSTARGEVRVRVPPTPPTERLRGMGSLGWMKVERFTDGRTEKWDFDWESGRGPMPRLLYDKANTRLWTMGGRYRIDGEGFRSLGGPTPLVRRQLHSKPWSARLQPQIADWRQHHGGLPPREKITGLLSAPPAVILVGWLTELMYRADRNDGDGLSNWEHVFRRPFPVIGVSTSGRSFGILGGGYTVVDGWLLH